MLIPKESPSLHANQPIRLVYIFWHFTLFSDKTKLQQQRFVCAKAQRQQQRFVCAKAQRQQQRFICAKAQRQQQRFVCAKAQRQQQCFIREKRFIRVVNRLVFILFLYFYHSYNMGSAVYSY
ncbi:hypothetical protein ACIQYL_22630 [Lysinibacillus xylanilyticus]|uniref:hypothetical protein n=1 Tax=Lysinibacillus xylanilyticus TaxID=582475 RepID=UPI0037FC524C